MTPGVTASRGGPHPRDIATAIYIGAVLLLALSLFLVSLRVVGLEVGTDLVILAVLGVVLVLVEEAVAEGRALLSLWSILLLACQAIVGPAGAGLVGAVMGLLQGRRLKLRNRVFNAGQASAIGGLGGLAFAAAHGTNVAADLTSVGAVMERLALPLVVADIAQFVSNTILLSGVFVISGTGTLRTVIVPLVRSTGLAYLGYSLIAFLMVVLWIPAGLGAAATLVVLAPLLVAQWAFRQHAEELRGQDRVLQVLVAAVEAKAPHLASHSARVATLCAEIAERLGLAPQVVADVRTAGMLHDVGQTTLPTTLVRQADGTGADLDDYPRRGVGVLSDLGFLRGALGPIAEHRAALDRAADTDSLAARVVGVADEYDLLTEVGTPDGLRLTRTEALDLLAERAGVDDRLLEALDDAVRRRPGVLTA